MVLKIYNLSKIIFLNLNTIILVSCPFGGYLDDGVNNQTNYQFPLRSYIHSLTFHEWCRCDVGLSEVMFLMRTSV